MFRSARIKLTFWYLLIIMIISIAFSSVIYRFLALEVDRFAQLQQARIIRQMNGQKVAVTFDRDPNISSSLPPLDEELIQEVKNRLYFAIAIINGVIFVVAGGLAYFVAGKTLQPIQDMVNEQHRFISDASHELKTPLTSLKTAFEVFLRTKKKTKKDTDELVLESIEEVNKLQRLTESLLQLAGTASSSKQIRFSPLSLSPLIKEVIKQLKPLAKHKHIEVQYIPKNISINGNADSIRELITILLDNAIKYSHPNSPVIITEAVQKNNCVITVSDKGIGISPKDMPFIFDRFYRADQARVKDDSNSYGLGLAIAKKIVKEHKGLISATSTIKQGTVFVVTIPLAIPTHK